MEEDTTSVGSPAPSNTDTAEAPLLTPDTPAEGATPGGQEVDASGGDTPPKGGEDQPLLTPGMDENGQSELVGAPESYEDFSMPEGFTLDDDTKTQVTEMFRELNLSQKGAQKLIDAYTDRVTAQKEADLTSLEDRRRQWRAQVRQSPTFATDRVLAIKGMNAVVNTPEERALFKDSWMSDHPALFGMFVKVGRLIGEDTPLPKGGDAASVEGAATDRFPIKL